MKKITLSTLAAVAALTAPGAAFAQDAGQAEVTVGANAGYHDLGIGDDLEDIAGPDASDGGAIFGGFIAVDFPVSSNFFVGVEGNANIGTDAIDADYGASGRLGYRAENGTKVYLRGGYQWVDVDAAALAGVDGDLFDEDDLGIDTTVGDYLVGAGVEVPVGQVSIRGNVDTISFETLRLTAGVGFRF
ncbi:outer membrane beta-barrel protein [uncultured Erythrobacter sp.]|uniref:outer membrane beta-barrel protein n=1 Tax=uncultured Erythrobacter sp. TaxID=263913 RepID=UPI002619DF7F|nr:outer membrane beta-barrel protein [uncultured Erythrobacter sp.]